MTIVLAVMACLVHYDLLGLMSNYHPYRQRTHVQFDEQHERHHYPVLEFDNLWMPRRGTDTQNAYYFKPTILVNNFDNNDNDDFWSVGSDDDRDSENDDFWNVDTDDDEDNKPANIESTSSSPSTGVCNDNDAVTRTCFFGNKSDASDKTNQQPPQSNFHTALTPVSNIMLTSSPDNHYSDDEDDDSDYYAPGEERDDDVF
ncbi:Hypothetical protein CINCED_3A020589 [Cinara cedri]|nr:Hypothetical protein CINCED_3A020589 [Cinara cedri]